MIEVKNAKIRTTALGYEDHGIFTFMLDLDYGGSGQGVGGYALDSYNKKLDRRVGSTYGIDLLIEILRVVEVETWEQLKGRHIRVKADYNKVYAIGNLLRDEWLDFEEFWKEKGLR